MMPHFWEKRVEKYEALVNVNYYWTAISTATRYSSDLQNFFLNCFGVAGYIRLILRTIGSVGFCYWTWTLFDFIANLLQWDLCNYILLHNEIYAIIYWVLFGNLINHMCIELKFRTQNDSDIIG